VKLQVVIPTYRRPEKLARCLASLERQTHPDVEVLTIEDEGREFAIGIWNRLAPTVTEGAFVYLWDAVALSRGCGAAAAAALELRWPNTDGVIGLHQRNIQGKAGTAQSAMGVIGARFLDRFPGRQPFCPDYARFHFDSELGMAARQLGRFHFCTEASLVHYHPAHYKAEADETHAIVRDPAEMQLDRQVWERRRAARLLWGVDNTLVGRTVE
jgi:hypothetical protein